MDCVRPVSLADNDLYKYTMGQAAYHQYPGAVVRYKFKCRNNSETLGKDPDKLKLICEMVNESIALLCKMEHSYEELNYLYNIRYIKSDFIDFLSILKLNSRYIKCYIKNGELCIDVEGPWVLTIWFEVLVLSIVSETYTLVYTGEELNHYYVEGAKRAEAKFKYLEDNVHPEDRGEFNYTDFSTRRRASYNTQEFMIANAIHKTRLMFAGTSNVHFAMKYKIPVFGTMAHEWVCAHQQLGVKVIDSQKAAFNAWLKEYRGDLGIALSDTVGIDAFLNDFDLLFSKVFDGCRQDSGNPYIQGVKIIDHYEHMNINSKTKSIIFSDGLDFETAVDLFYYFKSWIKTGFGIGTFFANDIGLPPPQIVMKMVECNGKPVAKVANDPGKAMCEDQAHEEWVKRVFHI